MQTPARRILSSQNVSIYNDVWLANTTFPNTVNAMSTTLLPALFSGPILKGLFFVVLVVFFSIYNILPTDIVDISNKSVICRAGFNADHMVTVL